MNQYLKSKWVVIAEDHDNWKLSENAQWTNQFEKIHSYGQRIKLHAILVAVNDNNEDILPLAENQNVLDIGIIFGRMLNDAL